MYPVADTKLGLVYIIQEKIKYMKKFNINESLEKICDRLVSVKKMTPS